MTNTKCAHEELTIEWNELEAVWQDSRMVWKDILASQFEKRFILPWEAKIPAFLSILETLNDELQETRRELR